MFRMFVSETYSIEDCLHYNSTTRNYVFNNASGQKTTLLKLADVTGDVYISADIKKDMNHAFYNMGVEISDVESIDTSTNAPNNIMVAGYSNNNGIAYAINSTFYGSNRSGSAIPYNTKCRFEMWVSNGTIRGKITKLSDSTVLYDRTITQSVSHITPQYAQVIFYTDNKSNLSFTYENTKVKPL